MKNLTLSNKIYIILIIILAVSSSLNVFLPQGNFLSAESTQQFPISKPLLAIINLLIMIFLYGSLGFIGLKLSKKLNFPDIWDEKVSNIKRFLHPAFVGIVIGGIFILIDVITTKFHMLGFLPHPPFPASLIASIAASIGEEIIFRLFFISFWVWLISKFIFKNKKNTIFIVVVFFSSVIFAFSHIPALMFLYHFKTVNQVPIVLLGEIIVLNGMLSIAAAYYLKTSGFLAAIGVHFWTDFVWHIIWGIVQ